MAKRLNILLVAEESAGIQMLRAIQKSDHNLVAVLASEKKAQGSSASVWATAQKLDVRLWSAKNVKQAGFAETLREEAIDILLNVHSLYIINEEVLKAPRIGAFNIHPGPLPHMAGLNAPSWAIYKGHKTHAVTIHKMEPGIDTGAIVYQKSFPIGDRDTGLSVALQCIREGLPLLQKLLDTAAEDPRAIPAQKQDLDKRNYYSKQVPQEGKIDWNKPAGDVHNFIRACDYAPFPSPWGHPRVECGGTDVTITQSALTGKSCDAAPGTILRMDEKTVAACADEWLEIKKAQLDGRKIDPAELPNLCI